MRRLYRNSASDWARNIAYTPDCRWRREFLCASSFWEWGLTLKLKWCKILQSPALSRIWSRRSQEQSFQVGQSLRNVVVKTLWNYGFALPAELQGTPTVEAINNWVRKTTTTNHIRWWTCKWEFVESSTLECGVAQHWPQDVTQMILAYQSSQVSTTFGIRLLPESQISKQPIQALRVPALVLMLTDLGFGVNCI